MIIRDVLRNFDFEMCRDVDIFVRKKNSRTNIKLGFGPTDNWIYDPTIETYSKIKFTTQHSLLNMILLLQATSHLDKSSQTST